MKGELPSVVTKMIDIFIGLCNSQPIALGEKNVSYRVSNERIIIQVLSIYSRGYHDVTIKVDPLMLGELLEHRWFTLSNIHKPDKISKGVFGPKGSISFTISVPTGIYKISLRKED